MKKLLLAASLLLAPIGASAAIPTSQRDALIAFYNATNGAQWTNHTGWLGAAGTECNWFGIRCDNNGSTVISIGLNDNNVAGTLPPETGAFPDLLDLTLFHNQLGGTIPPQIGNLAKLQRLELYENQLTGSLPPELGQLTKVTFFALGNNQFTGPIPKELGNLASVTFFSFNGNLLTGPLPPELGHLANVETFSLGYNQIDGTIPKELSQLTHVTDFELNNNALTGTIPKQLGQLPNVQFLFLQLNQLSGTIPPELGNLPKVTVLDLGLNKLTGSIPKELGQLALLEALLLDRNDLTGPVPVELAQLHKLIYLNLETNKLDGTIPRALGSVSSLQTIQLAGNRLTGSIPPELGNLAALQTLSVSTNKLSGTIPRELGKLSNLTDLDAYGMKLTGPLPPELGQLHQLESLELFDNSLNGPIPPSYGDLTKLTLLLLGGNRLSGTIPSELMRLSELTFLDLRGNRLTGTIPQDIDKLSKLQNLALFSNSLTGPLPAGVTKLTNLEHLRVDDNELTGTLPAGLGQLNNLFELLLTDNHFEGAFPTELTSLTGLSSLSIGGNRFTGAVPSQLGQLTNLQQLNIANNQFRGDLPSSLKNLTSLVDNLSDFRFNALTTSDNTLHAFLDKKQDGGDWAITQTLPPPGSVTVTDLSDRSAIVHWTPITYQADDGGYRVIANGGGGSVVTTTETKIADSAIIRGLHAATAYTFEVRTVTHPHGLQQSTIVSELSATTTGTTTAAVVKPALVELTTPPAGLVQNGTTTISDSFVLTNSGDTSTAITLSTQANFFMQSPASFTLAGGQSQKVKLTVIPQPPGSYENQSVPSGAGVPQGLTIPVRLLSTAPPAGTAVATAQSRIDSTGDANSTSTATARFTNSGTTKLSGIAVSDAPWLIAPSGLITIAPSAFADVTFTIDRHKKPSASHALAANLKLVYAAGATPPLSLLALDPNDTPGVSITTVSVVDTTRPVVGAATPTLAGNSRFIAGVAQITRGGATYISDVALTNSFGSVSVSDLRLYYGTATNPPAVAASLGALAPNQAVQLASVVKSVFAGDAQVGTIQVQGRNADRLLIHATLLNVANPRGAAGTAIPIFRPDRAVIRNGTLNLTGVRKNATMATDLYVQETSGLAASVTIDFLDANGASVGASQAGLAVGAFRLLELADAIPAGAVTAVVTVDAASSGQIVAYATVHDQSSGDSWAIADWSRFYALTSGDSLKLPFVLSDNPTTGGGRRRISPHATTFDATRTDVTIFNGGQSEASGTLRYYESTGQSFDSTLTIGSRQTLELSDVLATLFFRRNSSGYLVFTPQRGNEISMSGRVTTASGLGTSVPSLSASSGLRLGQYQLFADLEASPQSATAAKLPGTFRTSFGISETAGQSVKVRATLFFSDGSSPVATKVTNDYDLAPNTSLFFDDGVSAILGSGRDTFGTLHNVQLQFQVIDGGGAATVFVLSVDNGSGDSILRLE